MGLIRGKKWRKKSPNIKLREYLAFFTPLVFPPRAPRSPPGHAPKPENPLLKSILKRFWVVLGRPLGVILGTFGGQDAPSSVKNASWKCINIKNVNFHQILRFPIPERKFGPQDALQNAPRSAQKGSKRLLKSNFFALESRLNF